METRCVSCNCCRTLKPLKPNTWWTYNCQTYFSNQFFQVSQLITWRLSQSIFIYLSERENKTILWYDVYPKTDPWILVIPEQQHLLPKRCFCPICTVPLLTILFNLSSCNISPPNFHHAFQTIKLFKRIRIWQDSVNVKYAQGFIHLSKHTSIRSAFKRSPTFTFISLHV